METVDWPEAVKRRYAHFRDVSVESFGDGTVEVLFGLDSTSMHR